MADKTRDDPLERPTTLRLPRGINSQVALRRAQHKVGNWRLAGKITDATAQALMRVLEGMGNTIVAEANEKLLARLDAIEAKQALAGKALRPSESRLFGRA